MKIFIVTLASWESSIFASILSPLGCLLQWSISSIYFRLMQAPVCISDSLPLVNGDLTTHRIGFYWYVVEGIDVESDLKAVSLRFQAECEGLLKWSKQASLELT